MTKPLFEAFRLSMMNNAKGSRKQAKDDFISEMKSDKAYIEMLAGDYFDRMAAVWEVKEGRLGKSFGRTEVSQDKIDRTRATLVSRSQSSASRDDADLKRKNSEARAKTAFEELKSSLRAVVLLDLEMPDGKPLRYATGAECKKAGGFYSEIAKHLKPSQVVDRHLTENDLQNIKARFYQANAA